MKLGDHVYLGLHAGTITAIEGAFARVQFARHPGRKASHTWHKLADLGSQPTYKEAQHGHRHSDSTAHAAGRRAGRNY